MTTNEATLQKLSSKLQKLVATTKKGSKYVKGGMYGVEQVARVVEELDSYMRTATSLTYDDIDTLVESVSNIETYIGNTIGLVHDKDLSLKPSNNLQKWNYIGTGGHKVYLPSSTDLINQGYESWKVTLENLSISASNISITAQSENSIDSSSAIAYNYGSHIVVSWNADDTFTSESLGGGGGGGGGDVLSDHIQDVDSPTYYYYGLNRNGNWEILRNEQSDVNNETLASEINNPSYVDLTTAWANRLTLTYA